MHILTVHILFSLWHQYRPEANVSPITV